jgi:DNA polymerase-3 subunit gamma/tau
LLERIVEGDGKGAIAEAERIASRSLSLDSALGDLAAMLHRIALAQAGAFPAEDDPDAQRVIEMSQRIDAGRVQVMYQIALLGRRDLALAPDEFAGFTMALLRMLSFADSPKQGGLQKPRAEVKVAAPRAIAGAVPRAGAMPPLQPAEPIAPTAAAAPVAFDGDWPALVERLRLTGMAGMAARHAELDSFQGNHLQLVVPETHRVYGEKAYQEKLKADLAAHFGAGFRLSVRVGATSGASVAAAQSRETAEKQASAAEAIEEDPFVRDLVRDLGAEVVPSSIRPADGAGKLSSDKR